MVGSLQPFEQYCTQRNPCGEVVESGTGAAHRVRRWAVVVEGKIVLAGDTKEQAIERAAKCGIEVR